MARPFFLSWCGVRVHAQAAALQEENRGWQVSGQLPDPIPKRPRNTSSNFSSPRSSRPSPWWPRSSSTTCSPSRPSRPSPWTGQRRRTCFRQYLKENLIFGPGFIVAAPLPAAGVSQPLPGHPRLLCHPHGGQGAPQPLQDRPDPLGRSYCRKSFILTSLCTPCLHRSGRSQPV